MPGPLSCTLTLKRLLPVASTVTQISGTIPASSQASSELSTASLTVVNRALRGLSKPRRCRFLAKNSLTEMSRCLAAIVSAVARRLPPVRPSVWSIWSSSESPFIFSACAWPLAEPLPLAVAADAKASDFWPGEGRDFTAAVNAALLYRRGDLLIRERWGETGQVRRLPYLENCIDCIDFAGFFPVGFDGVN